MNILNRLAQLIISLPLGIFALLVFFVALPLLAVGFAAIRLAVWVTE